MIALIDNNRNVQLDQVPDFFNTVLYDHFSAVQPGRRYIDTDQYGWDGVYRRYNINRQVISITFLSEVERLCKKHKIPFEVFDERLCFFQQNKF